MLCTKKLTVVFSSLIVICLLCGCGKANADASFVEKIKNEIEISQNDTVQNIYAEDIKHTQTWEKNESANEKYAPRITLAENGALIQKVPLDTTAVDIQAGDTKSKTVSCWNNYFLNADNRGCTACHSIEDALESMETFHGEIYFGYNVEQGIQNCFGCHSFYDNRMKDAIHTLHQRSNEFSLMNGNCESCHYIDVDDNGSAVYKRWDYVKYDVMRGFKDLSAENALMTFEWNQTEISNHNQMYYKSVKSNPNEWVTSDSQISQEEFDNWTISFTGALDIECDLTLSELIDKYGTETRLMKSHCTVNGPGQGMIYQAEVTGIPVSKIIEDLGVHSDAVIMSPVADDGYCYPVAVSLTIKEDALLVIGMNGDTIYPDQGWPVAIWFNELSAGNFVKRVSEIRFETKGDSMDFYGDFTDATTGLQFDKPNVGVLNSFDGQIFEPGSTVHLEGYADAWNEPIVKIEFSLDSGKTWREYNILNADTSRWVYWKLDIQDLIEGSYLLKIRVSSKMADGTIRTNDVENQMTNYMFNVRSVDDYSVDVMSGATVKIDY